MNLLNFSHAKFCHLRYIYIHPIHIHIATLEELLKVNEPDALSYSQDFLLHNLKLLCKIFEFKKSHACMTPLLPISTTYMDAMCERISSYLCTYILTHAASQLHMHMYMHDYIHTHVCKISYVCI